MKRISVAVIGAALLTAAAEAKVNVLTTIPDLTSLASEVGGAEVSVESIAKGTQDPHGLP
jgi:zinc/manganese transport system substrate-binding protein